MVSPLLGGVSGQFSRAPESPPVDVPPPSGHRFDREGTSGAHLIPLHSSVLPGSHFPYPCPSHSLVAYKAPTDESRAGCNHPGTSSVAHTIVWMLSSRYPYDGMDGKGQGHLRCAGRAHP